MITLLQYILDMIYPVRCPICDEIVLPKSEKACLKCKEKLVYIEEPKCKKCGKPIELEEIEFCSDCQRKVYHFEKGYALWVYDEVMRHSIAKFKYHSKKEYAKFYTHELLIQYKDKLVKLEPDVIVPVPIHKSKLLQRGYNQAEILARGIGKELEIPVLAQMLIRNKKTLPQKNLSDKERMQNLLDAFSFNEKAVGTEKGSIKKVLLVDDIYTTGATLDACASLLKSHGILEVYYIVLCIGKGY